MSAGRDFDGVTPLTPDNVDGVTVTIWNPSKTKIRDAVSMLYNPDDDVQIGDTVYHGFWYYMFDSDGQNAGTFRAKVIYTGLDGKPNWEWKRFRLQRDPVPA